MAEPRQLRISVITLWVGILIPIVAALIPFGIKYVLPEHHLEYSIAGPISVKGNKALQIKIQNGGEKLEKNVRISLKVSYLWRLEDKKDPTKALTVDTQANHTVKKEGDWLVVQLGDLRPGEVVDVGLLSEIIDITLYSTIEPSGIAVKSDEHLAQLKRTSELEAFMYQAGFWMFALLMVLLLAAGIYQQYFMDPKKREEMILKEIDKLPKG